MPRRSVSFIELITAVAIMSIISATTGISFTLYDRRRLEVSGKIMAADMALTRQMAATYHRNYAVDFNISNDIYSIYNGSIAAANLIKRKALGLNLTTVCFPVDNGDGTTTDVDLTPSSIRFNFPFGTITRTNGNPISDHTGGTNPINMVIVNITAGSRYVEVSFSGDTGSEAYRVSPPGSHSHTCAIATACFSEGKNPELPVEVRTLQKFRDKYLTTNIFGKALMDCYYSVSPAVAGYIGKRNWAKKIIRVMLEPVVLLAQSLTGSDL